MMRLAGFAAVVIASLILCFGVFSRIDFKRDQPAAKWETGYWFWRGGAADIASNPLPIDALFVEAGTISKYGERWGVYAEPPRVWPEAHAYWIVFRCEKQAVPDASVVKELAKRVAELREDARQNGWNVIGVQLDIDSPTRALPEYAKFLQEFRKNLPKEIQISITGLLDWFRDGTAIADVIKEVDEFVPQFYDAEATPLPNDVTSIAKKIDAAKWGPRFDRFGKRYRIGVSTFGRARSNGHSGGGMKSYYGSIFRDAIPLDLAMNPAFTASSWRNDANELVVRYVANRDVNIEWNQIAAGEGILFTLPTSETVRSAVAAAKSMRGCGGVVFFRWPSWDDALVMQPDEVLAAAGGVASPPKASTIQTIDGSCAAVSCVDLYLMNARPLAQVATRFRIKSSTEFEYFLPQKNVPVKLAGSSALELSLPPFTGQHRMFLGRAVTSKASQFTVEDVR